MSFIPCPTRRHEAARRSNDKDFGEPAFKQGKVPGGVLLLRLAGLIPDEKIGLLARTMAEHGDELARAFSVLTQNALRIRRIDTGL